MIQSSLEKLKNNLTGGGWQEQLTKISFDILAGSGPDGKRVQGSMQAKDLSVHPMPPRESSPVSLPTSTLSDTIRHLDAGGLSNSRQRRKSQNRIPKIQICLPGKILKRSTFTILAD
jgi:hypothetical protein